MKDGSGKDSAHIDDDIPTKTVANKQDGAVLRARFATPKIMKCSEKFSTTFLQPDDWRVSVPF